jgi:hypothetical protein
VTSESNNTLVSIKHDETLKEEKKDPPSKLRRNIILCDDED